MKDRMMVLLCTKRVCGVFERQMGKDREIRYLDVIHVFSANSEQWFREECAHWENNEGVILKMILRLKCRCVE